MPLEFLPFVALSVCVGAVKGVAVVLYAIAGAGGGYLWRLLHVSLLRLLAPRGENEAGAGIRKNGE